MKVLVASASRYGATAEIARRIGAVLRAGGHEVEVLPVADVRDVAGYDACVVGSGVYFGKWLRDARNFVRRNSTALARVPVWLFSSGPLDTPTQADRARAWAEAEPVEIATFRSHPGFVEHRLFPGSLIPGRLGLRDRFVRALPAGRALLPATATPDLADVERWAEGIARDLVLRARAGSDAT